MEAIADPKKLVRHSYDQISYAYRGDSYPSPPAAPLT